MQRKKEITPQQQLTPMETESSVEGNLTINLLPAFSSESFSGLKRHTTLMLHSPDPSAILSNADY